MNTRLAIAGAALLLALAGCHAASGSPTAASPAATDGRSPQAILLASLPQRSSVPFRFSISGGDDTISGVIDGRRTAAQFDLVNHYALYSMRMGILVLGQKAWVKMRLENDPGLAGDVRAGPAHLAGTPASGGWGPQGVDLPGQL